MRKCKLGDIAEFRNGVNYSKGEQGYSYKCIGVTDFSQEYVMSQFEECAKVELDNAINSDYILEDGDILLVRSNGNKNLIGRSMMVFPKDEKVIYSGFCIRCRITSESVYPAYVLFILKDALVKGRFAKNQQTNINNINQTVLSDLEIMLPDYPLQKKIADILLAFTNKIEQNKLMIEVLESMSKTLYDYWFVQFDFLDANGNPYKTSGGKMEWNETLSREIPEGWEVRKVKDIEAKIVTGKTPSTARDDFYNGNIPFVTIGDIRNHVFVTNTDVRLTKAGAESQSNKYLPPNSLCVSCIASPGEIGFTTEWSQTNQQINSIVIEDEDNRIFLYFALKDYFLYNTAVKTGNTFANMSKTDFSEIALVYPTKSVLKVFAKKTQPIFRELKKAELENQKLITLRDFLLPMLMNGQVTFCQ